MSESPNLPPPGREPRSPRFSDEVGFPSGSVERRRPARKKGVRPTKKAAPAARKTAAIPATPQSERRVITRTVERIEVIPKTKRSKADGEKIAKAANALIEELRTKRDSLPHGI